MAVSKSRRFEVFKRDRFTCQYCGQTPPAVVLEVDHVHPVSEGGTDDPENLVAACFDCNRGKGARLLGDVPASLAERAERQEEIRAQVEAYNAILMQERQRYDDAIERLGRYWFECLGEPGFVFGAARVRSVRTFLDRLAEAEILEAIDIALAQTLSESRQWKYFCGICWRKIRRAEGEVD